MDEVSRKLTPREEEVVKLVARGLTNKEIAHQLGIHDQTVKNHLTAIRARLGFRTRVELGIWYAIETSAA